MQKLNIIIISRTMFPLLSPRAFRSTSLAKEMARRGHNVTLYAVLGNYDYSDFEKETGIVVNNIGNMLFSTSDSDGDFRYTFFDKILYHSLHRILEFPDIEFFFRVYSVLKKEKRFDLLLTVAYPHPIHWGGALAKFLLPKDKFPKKWIADCGDPYMGDPINKKKYFYFKYIEKWWCRMTDYIVIPLEEGKNSYYSEFESKIKVIPQGVDFSSVKINKLFVKNDTLKFSYAGTVYPGQRDPTVFLNYIKTLDRDFKFIVYTNNINFYLPFKDALKHKLEIRKYIPREDLIEELSQMDFLINLKNPYSVQAPSKLIDYSLSKRPIIDISKEFQEIDIFNEFLEGNYENQNKILDISQFDITNVAGKFIELYND